MTNGSDTGLPTGFPSDWCPRTQLPCPPWCDNQPGHGFESRDPATGTLARFHTLRIGEFVEVYAQELAVTEQGPLWSIDTPRIYVGPDLFAVDVTNASRLATELTAAVVKLGTRQ